MPHFTPADLQKHLDAHHIDATLVADIGSTPTVAEAALALDVEPAQIVKTLLFLLKQADGARQPVVVISHGEGHVDKKALARHFGVGAKKVKLADGETVLHLLGYPAGGVPPLGHRTPLPAIIDASVMALDKTFDVIFAGGGDDQTMLRLSVAELRRAVEAEAPSVELVAVS